MKPVDLLVRCYAFKEGEQWIAVCLDLNLASQGDTFLEVRRKLFVVIGSYAHEALTEDYDDAEYLLTRKAPLREWLRYWYFCVMLYCRLMKQEMGERFREALPVTSLPVRAQ